MSRRTAVGLAAAVLIAAGGWVLAQQGPATPKVAPGAAPPPAPAAVPALEVGKRYTFYWERGAIINAVALDTPCGNWVRVRYRLESGKEADHWVNLATVTYFIELPAAK